MTARVKALALALFLTAAQTPAFAVNPNEMLQDPALEARAREISAEVRCLVCQNQSVDDSNADLARDLRVLIRERLVAGDTNEQVLDFLVSRYGEYVLLKPTFSEKNLVLWLFPLVLLIGAGGVLLLKARRKVAASAPQELSGEEKERLEKLLGGQ